MITMPEIKIFHNEGSRQINLEDGDRFLAVSFADSEEAAELFAKIAHEVRRMVAGVK